MFDQGSSNAMSFFNMQKQGKYTHGAGENVFPRQKSPVILVAQEASKRTPLGSKVHCQLSKVNFLFLF